MRCGTAYGAACTLLTAGFCVAKLAGQFNVEWLWCFALFWATPAVFVVGILVYATACAALGKEI